MKAKARIGRSARSGRYMPAKAAKGRPDAVVEVRPRHRDMEVMSALGRIEAVLSSVDRRLAFLEAVQKDAAAALKARHNHRTMLSRPDWMSS